MTQLDTTITLLKQDNSNPMKVDSIQKIMPVEESNTTSLIDHCFARLLQLKLLSDSVSSVLMWSLCKTAGSDVSNRERVSICANTRYFSGTGVREVGYTYRH